MNMTERVALSILNSDRMAAGLTPVESRSGIPDSDGYVRNATAAIQAMRDPTPEMIEAGKRMAGEDAIIVGVWIAMIDAALIDASPIDTNEMEPIDTSFGVGDNSA